MTILILNWRDIKNPAGGGAEILTHEIAKRWVQKGHKVIQFSSSFKNAKSKETIDGVQFIRKGKWWSVHFFVFFYYMFILKKSVDVVIDEVHWFPFFSKLYAPKITIALTCEVANKLFFTLFPRPIAFLFRQIEKVYLFIYQNTPTMVISESTKKDLLYEGHISSNIIVLPMGLTAPTKIKYYPKEEEPTLIYVARLNKQKGIFDAIEAFSIVKNDMKNAKLWVVGSGDANIIKAVKKISKNKNLEKSVRIFGFVSEEKKFELISRAHLLISPSVQEGWGLTVPEAGLIKTPAVVYNIQGFRDIIEDGKDGMLSESNPKALAKEILEVLHNKNLFKRLQKGTEMKAKSFSWDKTATKSLAFMQKEIRLFK